MTDEERFSEVSKRLVIAGDIRSALSDNPAEIFHHIYRRLNNPDRILDPYNLVPLTATEHGDLHNNRIEIVESGGVVFCLDRRWDRVVQFRLYLDDFRRAWQKALE